VKEIRLWPNVSAEIRAIDQPTALKILRTIDAYARSGEGPVKALNGKFEGLLRLRVGNYRVLFDETPEVVTVHRIRDRRDAYRS
jgi:mRNA-degrading endonuclease RelE of RelBE toxin-antitoxin system